MSEHFPLQMHRQALRYAVEKWQKVVGGSFKDMCREVTGSDDEGEKLNQRIANASRLLTKKHLGGMFDTTLVLPIINVYPEFLDWMQEWNTEGAETKEEWQKDRERLEEAQKALREIERITAKLNRLLNKQ